MLNIKLIYFFVSLIIKIDGINFYKEEIIHGDKTYNSYKFNIYHHLSGISPYFETNTDELSPDIPNQCQLNKSIYLIRHGSVYVDDYDYDYIIKPFLKRLNKALKTIQIKSHKLLFLFKWKSPITDPKVQVEKLTKSGVLEAYELGIQLSYRYSNLLSKQNKSSFRIWASSSQRTKQTAYGILSGLFPGTKSFKQVISISEAKNLGANSLTPTKTCQKFESSKGAKEANIWLDVYTKPILKRLNSYIKNFSFQPMDIFAMQQLCGYETVIRGSSPFCQLFTAEEWISFEYYFDIKYYFELGYGNYLSPYLGIHWVKAVTDQLQKSSQQKLFINVIHREMIPIVLVALGLFDQTNFIQGNNIIPIFPLNEIFHNRLWKSSEMIPFLGRIQLQLVSCSSTDSNGPFVRILVNSSVKPLPGCSQGPGESCPLHLFVNYINQRYQKYKNFSDVCQKDNNRTIDYLTFYQNIV